MQITNFYSKKNKRAFAYACDRVLRGYVKIDTIENKLNW